MLIKFRSSFSYNCTEIKNTMLLYTSSKVLATSAKEISISTQSYLIFEVSKTLPKYMYSTGNLPNNAKYNTKNLKP